METLAQKSATPLDPFAAAGRAPADRAAHAAEASAATGEAREAGEATEAGGARSAPFPAEWTVRRARDAYLAENGFTVEAYDAKWTEASFFFLHFSVPNTKTHRWAIMMHDLHHVATGFGTDLVGEAEISAWEARRGLSGLGAYVASIVVVGALTGLVLGPRRTVAAWRASSSEVPSLFCDPSRYERLLAMTVGELRELLGVPRRGVFAGTRRLHPRAPEG